MSDEERKELAEENDQKSGEKDGKDPTKEAFFSDMSNAEEEIESEAYDLVEHALSLVASKYYDDAIEVLRQAIGLYKQINREAEINAINDKISELYLLKEQAFVESEAKPLEEVKPSLEEVKEGLKEETPQTKAEEQKAEKTPEEEAVELVEQANELVEIDEFEEAIDRYRHAIMVFRDLKKEEEIAKINEAIKVCRTKQAEFLRMDKREAPVEAAKTVKIEASTEERKKEYEEIKKTEEKRSQRAYELMEKASGLAREHEYDSALGYYEEAANIFKSMEWDREFQKAKYTIVQLKEENELYLKQIEEKRIKEEREREQKEKEEEALDRQAKEIATKEAFAKQEKLKELELNREDEEKFESEIQDQVDKAESIARDYEQAIRKGKFEMSCPYEEIIDIYALIRKKVLERGWKEEAAIYTNQIKKYSEKLEKDKKLRDVESQKAQKQKEIEDFYKDKKDSGVPEVQKEKIEVSEELQQKEAEIEDLKNQIESVFANAEKKTREYEIAIKRGKFETPCPYPEIIDTFTILKQVVQDKELAQDVAIFNSQILTYQEKLEKDKKLREIEAQKAQKQKEIDESHKIKKEEKVLPKETEMPKEIQEKYQEEIELDKFKQDLEEVSNKAERTSREYEMAIKKGKFETPCPYPEIIDAFTALKQTLQEKGLAQEVAIAASQALTYQEKLEKDKKIREIEVQKAHKQKEIDDLHKVKKEEKIVNKDVEKLKDLEQKYKAQHELDQFKQEIEETSKKAERSSREYEMAIKKGKFETPCPFPEIIDTFTNIKKMLEEKNQQQDVAIFASQIRSYQEKLEKDKKIRDIEAQKIQKQKEIDDSHKIKKDQKVVTKQVEKTKDYEEKNKEQLELDNYKQQIELISNDIDRKTREYEMAIKRGKFDTSCPFPEIIETFTKIKQTLEEKGLQDEIVIYASQIRTYQEKLEKDKKLRAIEEKKAQKGKIVEETMKPIKEVDKVIEKAQEVDPKKKEKEEKSDRALKLIDEAEGMVKNYESRMRKDILYIEDPYDKVIELYKEARKMFQEIEWVEESNRLISTIKYYKDKKEKDEKLRTIEKQKLEKSNIVGMGVAEPKEDITEKQKKVMEIEEKKKQRQKEIDDIFEAIKNADKMEREYESDIKMGGIFAVESPYEKIVAIYRVAKDSFEKIGWMEESEKMINSIKFYKEKEERDKKLREIEKSKAVKDEEFKATLKAGSKTDYLEREKRIQELGQEKKKAQDVYREAFKTIETAEKSAKVYEQKLKEGEFLPCPYEAIIEIYRDARKTLEDVGWTEEANKLNAPINYYKDKLETDKKLRELKAEKVRREEEQLREHKLSIEKEREKGGKLLVEKQQELQLKSQKENEKERLKLESFNLMDRAKTALNQKKYDESIEMYEKSKNYFSEIEWMDGVKMVNESIAVVRKRKEEFELRMKQTAEKQAEKAQIEKALEEKLVRIHEVQKKEAEQKKREELKRIQSGKERESDLSKKAFDLLEEGTRLLENNKFDEASAKYTEARDIFKELGWQHEVSKINNDLMLKLKKGQKESTRFGDFQKKKEKEEMQLQELLKKADESRIKQEKAQHEEKRKKIVEFQVGEKLNQKVKEEINSTNSLIETMKYNEAILKLNGLKDMMEKAGWKDEIAKVNQQIQGIKNNSQVPLIVLEVKEANENLEKFESAYKALDKASQSIEKNLNMKAISELNEAKHNLKETKIGAKFVSGLETKIDELKKGISKKKQSKEAPKGLEFKDGAKPTPEIAYDYMDKANKEERRNNFDKAIEYATAAVEIFDKLGSEWAREQGTITQHVQSLKAKQGARKKMFQIAQEDRKVKEKEIQDEKQEDERLKKEIEEKRAERHKRIQELMDKKKNE